MTVVAIGNRLLIRMLDSTSVGRRCHAWLRRLRLFLRLRSLDTTQETFEDWSDRQW